jgi:hypothetical protein
MEVVRPSDARAFLDLAGPLLERDEARNQLPLGIAALIVEHPDIYPEARFWVVRDGVEIVAAALRTPPFDLVLADPVPERVPAALLDAVVEQDPDVPGVIGNQPYVGPAAEALAGVTHRTTEVTLRQGVYALGTVLAIPKAPGSARAAGASDRELLKRWIIEFAHESLPNPERDLERLDRGLDARLSPGSGGFWLWEDEGEAVSLSGFGGPTGSGIRIGPVYTPPELRRRGYATALVAEQSRWLLEQGYRFCFLYTDLTNPTSNAIYERIGYRRVGESTVYRFG